MNPVEVLNAPLPAALPEREADAIIPHIIKIGQFSKLDDDWDSYGGKAASLAVCKKGRDVFVHCLQRAFLRGGSRLAVYCSGQ